MSVFVLSRSAKFAPSWTRGGSAAPGCLAVPLRHMCGITAAGTAASESASGVPHGALSVSFCTHIFALEKKSVTICPAKKGFFRVLYSHKNADNGHCSLV